MKRSDKTCRWNPLASSWILAGLIGVMTFGFPQIVAAQTGSTDVCEAAQKFAAADQEVDRVATASQQEQLAVQEAWHGARAALARQLPAGEARSRDPGRCSDCRQRSRVERGTRERVQSPGSAPQGALQRPATTVTCGDPIVGDTKGQHAAHAAKTPSE